MNTPAPRYSRITGTGSHLPPRRLSNDDMVALLAARGVETSDAWIVERTGIRARHFARHALEAAGRLPEEVDLIIVATSTPDMVFPSTAAILQHKLGVAGCPAFDLQAVCSGFVYALAVADAMIRAGSARCALIVGATCVLFGDGAGAVVLEASPQPGILASDLHADGRHVGILCVPGTVAGGRVSGDPLLKMDGPAVFKLAVGVLDSAARAVLAKAGRTEADLDWLIPHQANIRIMQGTAKKLKLPSEKLIVTKAWAAASPGVPCCSTFDLARCPAVPSRTRTCFIPCPHLHSSSPARVRSPWECSTPGAITRPSARRWPRPRQCWARISARSSTAGRRNCSNSPPTRSR